MPTPDNHIPAATIPHQDLVAFEADLEQRGFVEIQTREIPGHTHNTEHAHPFEVRALMLDGELSLSCDGQTRTYRAGEVFTMAAGREHVEHFGAAGARYLVGRRYPD